MFAAQAQNALFDTSFDAFQAPARRSRCARLVRPNPEKIASSAALQADLFAAAAVRSERRYTDMLRGEVARLLAGGDRVFCLDDLCAVLDLDRTHIARLVSRSVSEGALDLWLLGEGYYAPTTMDFIVAENIKDQIIEDREIFAKPKVDTDALVAGAIAAQRNNVLGAWF